MGVGGGGSIGAVASRWRLAARQCHVSRAAARLRVVSGVPLPRQRRGQRQRLDDRLERRVVEEGDGEASDGGGEDAVRGGEEIAAARHLPRMAQPLVEMRLRCG